MARSTTAANAATDVAAFATDDGHAILGGRPATPEFIAQVRRQVSGLPPAGAPTPQKAPDPGPQLPFAHVAWVAVGREVQRLKAEAHGIERDLARGTIGATGQHVPHLLQAHADARAALDPIRAEVARLESLTDHAARVWAFERGAR
jgi:hypothetical protein